MFNDDEMQEIIEELISNRKEILLETINKNQASIKKIFGAGVRVNTLPNKLLKEKLLLASGSMPVLKDILVVEHQVLVSPVLTAMTFSDAFRHSDITAEGIRQWLMFRFKPSKICFKHYQNNYAKDESAEEHLTVNNLCGSKYDDSTCDLIIDNPATSFYEFVHLHPEKIQKKLKSHTLDGPSSFSRIGKLISELANRRPSLITAAAYFYTFGGDQHQAHCLMQEVDNNLRKKANMLAMSAYKEMAEENFGKALSMIDTELKRFPKSKGPYQDWPAWNIIKGICHLQVGDYIEASKNFMFEVAYSRGYSNIQSKLARSALERGKLQVPDFLLNLSELPRTTPQDRRAMSQKLCHYLNSIKSIQNKTVKIVSGERNSTKELKEFREGDGKKVPQEFAEIAKILGEYKAVSEKLHIAADNSDYDNMSLLLADVNKVHQDLCVEVVRVNEEYPGLLLIDTVKKLSDEEINFYTGSLDKLAENYASYMKSQFEESKKQLQADLEELGINLAAENVAINSNKDISQIRARYDLLIKERRIFKQIMQGKKPSEAGDVPSDIIATALNKAVEAVETYTGMSAVVSSINSWYLLKELAKDEEMSALVCNKILRLNDTLGSPIPGFLAEVGKNISQEFLVKLLQDLDLDYDSMTDTDLKALYDVTKCFDKNTDDLKIRAIGDVLFCDQTSACDIAKVIAQISLSPFLLRKLVDELHKQERYDEAIYLCSLLLKLKLVNVEDSLLSSMYIEMLARQLQQADWNEINDILTSIEWVSTANDAIACIVFSMKYNLHNTFFDLKYIYKKAYDIAAEQYPCLCEFAGEVFTNEALPWQDLWREVKAYQDVFEEYAYDLKKKSCYAAWSPAEEYQRHFVEYLQGIPIDETLDLLDEQEIIEEIQSTGLPEVKNSAVANMRNYLRTQINRLIKLRDLGNTGNFSLEKALRVREALRMELEAVRTLPALRGIASTTTSLVKELEW